MNYINNGSDNGKTAAGDVEIAAALPVIVDPPLKIGEHTMSYSVPGGVMSYYDSLSWNPPISKNDVYMFMKRG